MLGLQVRRDAPRRFFVTMFSIRVRQDGGDFDTPLTRAAGSDQGFRQNIQGRASVACLQQQPPLQQPIERSHTRARLGGRHNAHHRLRAQIAALMPVEVGQQKIKLLPIAADGAFPQFLIKHGRVAPPPLFAQGRRERIDGEAVPPCTGSWPLTVDGEEVGAVTSAAWSPDFAVNVAIGMIQSAHWDAGTRLQVATPHGARGAEVCKLPHKG